MNVKHLQALVGITEAGSFSGAAELVGTVQSNISAHVARLEMELSTTLVDRATCKLTEEGTIVVERARRMIAEMEALVADVGAMHDEIRGQVRLGTIGTAGRWIVPLLAREIKERLPEVVMTVTDSTSSTLEPLLSGGQIDLGVVTMPVLGEELSASPLFDEDLVLVVPHDHRLADPSHLGVPITLEELATIELLLPLKGTALREEIDSAMKPSGLSLRPSMELDGLWIIAALTFDGHGHAILPATAVSDEMRKQFCLRAIQGRPRRRVGVALRARTHPSAPTRAIIDLLYAIMEVASDVPGGVHPTLVERRLSKERKKRAGSQSEILRAG